MGRGGQGERRDDLRKYNRYKCTIPNKSKGMKKTVSRTALLLEGFSGVLVSSQTFTSHLTGEWCLTSPEGTLCHTAEKVAGFGCPVFGILCSF